MPSSATSPTARSLDSGIAGARRLANTIDSRSGAFATSSRAMCRASGASSTRWKSSKIRTAPPPAIVGSSADEGRRARVTARAARSRPPPAAPPSPARSRVVLSARGDEVVQERDPVAIVRVEPIPERPHPASAGEVGKQGGLPVARIGEEQHDPAMDLDPQPVEQAWALERLVAQRGTLDLGELDRVAADLVAQVGTPGTASTPADRPGPTGIGNGLLDGSWRRPRCGAKRSDRSSAVSTERERGRSGMGAMVARTAQPSISCEVADSSRSAVHPIRASALVFEADLELDSVLDDLAVLDVGASTSRPRRSGCCGPSSMRSRPPGARRRSTSAGSCRPSRG